MKVKELIKRLLDMPLGANVYVDLKQSTNSLVIDEVYNCGNTVVSLVVDYRDFELDEEAVYEIEKEKDEIARDAEIDMAIKNYKENEVPREKARKVTITPMSEKYSGLAVSIEEE